MAQISFNYLKFLAIYMLKLYHISEDLQFPLPLETLNEL